MGPANEKKGKATVKKTKAKPKIPKTTRFIMSHRRAGYKSETDKVRRSRDKFESSFEKVMASSVDLLSHNSDVAEDKRGLKIVDADYLDVNELKKELSSETMIERLITRKTQLATPLGAHLSSVQSQGAGNELVIHVKHSGHPVSGVDVRVGFSLIRNPEQGSSQHQETNAKGKVVFEYNGEIWKPASVTYNPKSDFWPQLTLSPPDNSTIEMMALPKTGPLSWWHESIGVHQYEKNLGSGIKVGVVDTGVGPHPYLDHVTSIGAFIDAEYLSLPKDGRDSGDHGTHVSGIIGARIQDGANEYTGIAPGADLFVARVFPKGRSATQGDISLAIDALASEHGVHLINLSLGSAEPSIIERDAVEFAMECGTLCICAAGNDYGGHVCFPAGYPETVAVSGLGYMHMYPQGTVSASFYPVEADKYSSIAPLYLASYSNIGKEIVCCAPGTGIISTVPAYDDHKTPYLAMDGTSMASPMTTATLAVYLSKLQEYKNLPADKNRFDYAAHMAMARSSNSLNLNPTYQGYGMINR